MNEIVKYNDDHLLLKPNVLQVVKKELFDTVNASIARCYADLNFKVPDDTDYLVNEVTNSILKNYPSMRLQEIPVAFSRGIRKEYGDFFGLCVISFELFVAGYLNSEERLKLAEQKNRLLIEERIEPSVDEKFNTAKNLCVDTFLAIKSNAASKSITIMALSIYSFLDSIGLIDKDYKMGIMQEALSLTVKSKEIEASFCMDLLKRRALNSELELLKDNILKDIITKDQYTEIIKYAKRIALNNYFRDLMLNESNLAELIEEKRELFKTNANAGK